MSAADELVDVIDDAGRTVGVVTRQEMRRRRLPHRSTAVLVFDRAGRLFIHLRTPSKDLFPSHWDVAVGGVLAAGEAYAEGVRREVHEELGIDADPEDLFLFCYEDAATVVQARVYRLVHDGPFQLQSEEIVRGEFVRVEEVLERSRHEPFCPDGLAVLRAFQQRNPTMRVLLGSGGFRTPERIETLRLAMRAHFGDAARLLFIPYALADHDGYLRTLAERGLDAGYELDGIHRHVVPKDAVRAAAALYIGGGNTFRLLHALYQFDLIDVLRERVGAGVPYLGISAGANVAGPSLKTSNDMPIIQPPSFAALGLVPFQINAHYYTGATWVKSGDDLHEHFGETRDERLREFHEVNDTPVIGLWEGGLLHCGGRTVRLAAAPARIFRKGMPPVDVQPGTELSALVDFTRRAESNA